MGLDFAAFVKNKKRQNKMQKKNYELSAKLLRLANRGAYRAQERARRAIKL